MELRERAREYFGALQDAICSGLESIEGAAGKRFVEESWAHEAEGGGVTRVLAGGRVFERAGVNISDVAGRLTERLAQRLEVGAQNFRATGISLVIHPLSPMVPTAHMNLRHIALEEGRSWFGGGMDLTPYYLFDEDAVHFHRTLKVACDRHDPGYYERFKKWCDEYFVNTHRGEARGVGGIFFDYLVEDPEAVFRFVRDVGQAFTEAYLPIVRRRIEHEWWDREREWQLVRRGRYVEFNLVHDRGTLFGLETRGRTESILISMPPLVRWTYDHQPEPGSHEARLLEVLRNPRQWA